MSALSLSSNASPAESRSSETGSSPRLLIVDDVADNRIVLARRFQRRGFEIVEADGGAILREADTRAHRGLLPEEDAVERLGVRGHVAVQIQRSRGR